MNRQKLLILLLLVAAFAVFFLSGADQWLTLDTLKSRQAQFQAWFDAAPWRVAGGFFLLYVIMTALSLPGAALLTLLAGALFGFGWGLLLVSFASTLGATLAFLIARRLLRDTIARRFRRQLAALDRGIERDGAFYLFTLRLVPVFPFFVINLAMGVTRLPTRTYYWVSQLGMLPGTAVYVNAGRELGEIERLSGIVSPGLLLSFALLGLFPLLARKCLAWWRTRTVYRGFKRPRRFDADIVVIGAGSAGLVASYIASAVNAKVVLAERDAMGGDCLNTGCVPSKALIRAARAAHEAREATRFGIRTSAPVVDFEAVMRHVNGAVAEVAPHDSQERYAGLGVEVLNGEARLTSPWTVRIGEREIATRHIIIATGARPRLPTLPGIEASAILTSDNLWALTTLPTHLVILGGGPIGCELGQAFARLGSRVSLIQRDAHLLPGEDPEVGELVAERLRAEGVSVYLETRALAVEQSGDSQTLRLETADGDQRSLPFERLLAATGRRANLEGLGHESLNLGLRDDGTLESDAWLATRYPNIWACGDVTGPLQFTHAGSHQAWHATVNALFGEIKRFRVDYRYVPHVTFTQPEVARVGINEREAKAQGIAYEVTHYAMSESDRAIAERATEGFVKILTVPGKDRILGATLVGEHAGEWLAELTLAMKHNIGLNKLLGTIHTYPTFGEASKAAAGQWKNAHKPTRVIAWLGRYFRWRRGG